MCVHFAYVIIEWSCPLGQPWRPPNAPTCIPIGPLIDHMIRDGTDRRRRWNLLTFDLTLLLFSGRDVEPRGLLSNFFHCSFPIGFSGRGCGFFGGGRGLLGELGSVEVFHDSIWLQLGFLNNLSIPGKHRQ